MEINNRFLFKAKRIDNGEWVQGFYYVFMGKHYIFEQPFENNNLTHQVDESTICQCTGLRDKNGRLIFENDILKCGSCTVVHWNEKYASWTLTRKGWMYDHFFGEAEDPEDCEIVGNIFDDSQLKEKYSKERNNMRKVEFKSDQLEKEAYEIYSNSDYNFFVDENGMYYGAIGNGEKFQLGSMKDVESFLMEG